MPGWFHRRRIDNLASVPPHRMEPGRWGGWRRPMFWLASSAARSEDTVKIFNPQRLLRMNLLSSARRRRRARGRSRPSRRAGRGGSVTVVVRQLALATRNTHCRWIACADHSAAGPCRGNRAETAVWA
jgi:hypothetical protein